MTTTNIYVKDHFPIQCWRIDSLTFGNKLHWNLSQIKKKIVHENVVCTTSAIFWSHNVYLGEKSAAAFWEGRPVVVRPHLSCLYLCTPVCVTQAYQSRGQYWVISYPRAWHSLRSSCCILATCCACCRLRPVLLMYYGRCHNSARLLILRLRRYK